jgi:hypothetical protein
MHLIIISLLLRNNGESERGANVHNSNKLQQN